MKVILSRKGFDSSAGKIPNMILPDGRLFSFPIPDNNSKIKYSDVESPLPEYPNLFELLKTINHNWKADNTNCHLDPDLNKNSIPHDIKWKPIFGQANAAQGHLSNHKVTEGDMFLFFGWFRDVELEGKIIKYKHGSKDRHIIYGYFSIGKVIDINNHHDSIEDWMKYHVHFTHMDNSDKKSYYNPNYLYVANETITFNNNIYPGCGLFKYSDNLVLTKSNNSSRSLWELPKGFYPFDENRVPLTYHEKIERWKKPTAKTVELKAAYRGQEFVFDLEEYHDLKSWIESLLNCPLQL